MQPVSVQTRVGEVVAAIDGAIYNLDELRASLRAHGVRQEIGSDATVLAHAFAVWGDDFVTRVDGMFALVIWETATQRLLLYRDRFGMKPLYYYRLRDGIAFASEPKGIMAHHGFRARLELRAMPMALQPRLALPGETPLSGLHEVAAAHYVVVTPERGPRAVRYWRLTSASHTDSYEDTVVRVRGLLTRSVANQLPSGAECAAMLSGGLDSSAVAALASAELRRRREAPLRTFCVAFEGAEDTFVSTDLRPDIDAPYAEMAAQHFGADHNVTRLNMADIIAAVPHTRAARDLPGWGQFDASMYLLFQHMTEGTTTAFSGEAADEFFGGYPYFFRPDMISAETFPWLGDAPRLSHFLSPEIRSVVDPLEDEKARYSQFLRDVPRLEGEDATAARMREVLFLGMCGPLSVILDRKDRMSMASGVEVRLPFCDHKLVEYVWNIPWHMKARGGLKGLLRDAVADLLPASTVNRRKSAYPHLQDQRYDAKLLQAASRILQDDRTAVAPLFDVPAMTTLIDKAAQGDLGTMLPGGASPAQLFVHIVELETWMQAHSVSVS